MHRPAASIMSLLFFMKCGDIRLDVDDGAKRIGDEAVSDSDG